MRLKKFERVAGYSVLDYEVGSLKEGPIDDGRQGERPGGTLRLAVEEANGDPRERFELLEFPLDCGEVEALQSRRE